MYNVTNAGVAGTWQAQPNQVASNTSSSSAVDYSRGYPVGDGSFVSEVQGTQPQSQRDLNFALMAKDAYTLNTDGTTGTDAERQLAEAGWQRLDPVGDHLVDADGNRIAIDPDMLHDPDTGFDAAIYQNDQGQYVVAYRGTDNWSLGKGGDATTNAGQAMGASTAQYQQAVQLAVRAEKVFGDGNVAITGHSLGGGLASAATLATDSAGVTFNAAGLSDGTLRDLGFASANEIRDAVDDSGQIRRYVVAGEVLDLAQEAVVPGLPDAVGHKLMVMPAQLDNPIGLHSAFVEALRENPAYEPGDLPPALQTFVDGQEAILSTAASAGLNLYDLGANSLHVLQDTWSNVGDVIQDDFAQGDVLPGTIRIAGDVADAALDVQAGVVRETTDFAGDVVTESSTLLGNIVRNTGDYLNVEGPADWIAGGIERGGQKLGSWVDSVGGFAADATDKVGDWAQQGMEKVAQGTEWVESKVVAGVNATVDAAKSGAEWAADKASDAFDAVSNSKLNPANWF